MATVATAADLDIDPSAFSEAKSPRTELRNPPGSIKVDGESKKVIPIPQQAQTSSFKKMQDQPSCDWPKGCKVVFIALAITGIAVGLVGLLVYLGILQISLTHVGTMSQAMGLYFTLGGFGGTLAFSLVLGVAECIACNRKQSAQHQTIPEPQLTTPQTVEDVEVDPK